MELVFLCHILGNFVLDSILVDCDGPCSSSHLAGRGLSSPESPKNSAIRQGIVGDVWNAFRTDLCLLSNDRTHSENGCVAGKVQP